MIILLSFCSAQSNGVTKFSPVRFVITNPRGVCFLAAFSYDTDEQYLN